MEVLQNGKGGVAFTGHKMSSSTLIGSTKNIFQCSAVRLCVCKSNHTVINNIMIAPPQLLQHH